MFASVIIVVLVAHSTTSQTAAEVCCENVGCFSTTKPWVTSTRKLPHPQCPPELFIQFNLYSRDNSRNKHTIKAWPDIELDSSDYDSKKTTVLFIHDFGFSVEDAIVQDVKDAFLQRTDANVILVDWTDDSNGTYEQAVSNSRVIAAQISRLLKYLMELGNSSSFHLIGHGVGAHTAGLVGKTVPGISRITGLDPAYPLYDKESKEVRLDAGDAIFVDVSHTNCHPVTGIGTCYPLGDVDFFFNGGVTQSACPVVLYGDQVTQMIRGNYSAFYDKNGQPKFECSHNLAVKYFSNAVSNADCTYWGIRRAFWRFLVNTFSFGLFSQFMTPMRLCDLNRCLPFGLNTTDYPGRGSFDVATSDSVPYCIAYKYVDVSMEKKLKKYEKHQEPSQTSESKTTLTDKITTTMRSDSSVAQMMTSTGSKLNTP